MFTPDYSFFLHSITRFSSVTVLLNRIQKYSFEYPIGIINIHLSEYEYYNSVSGK